ncbi:enoyl-ACP reductase, partial [Achromatium sp. WMS3]
MGFLQDKKILIVGVASERSIAWGTAQAMAREGAKLAFTYQTDKLKKRVTDLAAKTGSNLVLPCDVAEDAQIDAVFQTLEQKWDGLDCIVHSVAYAPREQLEGNYVDAVTRQGFATSHDISAYSFAALAKAGRKMLQGRNGAL